jgi:hypothetical protein
MNSVQIEQKSYERPPREGISVAQFLTVAAIERSAGKVNRLLEGQNSYGKELVLVNDCEVIGMTLR